MQKTSRRSPVPEDSQRGASGLDTNPFAALLQLEDSLGEEFDVDLHAEPAAKKRKQRRESAAPAAAVPASPPVRRVVDATGRLVALPDLTMSAFMPTLTAADAANAVPRGASPSAGTATTATAAHNRVQQPHRPGAVKAGMHGPGRWQRVARDALSSAPSPDTAAGPAQPRASEEWPALATPVLARPLSPEWLAIGTTTAPVGAPREPVRFRVKKCRY